MTQRFNPDRHHRRSIRLRGYDYARPGVYFITICTHDRGTPFGDIVNGVMHPNDAGMAAHTAWHAIPTHFPHARLDAFVVMPNHIHGVVVITTAAPTPRRVGATHASPLPNHPPGPNHAPQPNRAPQPNHGPPRPTGALTTPSDAPGRPTGPPPCSVGAIVGSYKSAVSRRINQLRDTPGAPIWQRDYYERIVRDDNALRRVRAYIGANPRRWHSAVGRA